MHISARFIPLSRPGSATSSCFLASAGSASKLESLWPADPRQSSALPHPRGNDLCGGRRLPALREINISFFLRVNASCVRDLGTSVQGHAQKCVTLSWCPSLTAPTPRAPPLPALLSTLIIWKLLLAHAEACVFRAVCSLKPWGEWERAARVFGKGGEGEVPKDPSESVRREGYVEWYFTGRLEIERALVTAQDEDSDNRSDHTATSPLPPTTHPDSSDSDSDAPSSCGRRPLFQPSLPLYPPARAPQQESIAEGIRMLQHPSQAPRAAKTNRKISAYFQQDTAEEWREYAEHAEMVRLREVEEKRKKAVRERVYATERMRQPLLACSAAWHAAALSPSCSRLAFPFAPVQHAARVALVLRFATAQHPQPVDDCPIAIGSVVLGMFMGRWGGLHWGAPTPDVAGVGMVMPGGILIIVAGTTLCELHDARTRFARLFGGNFGFHDNGRISSGDGHRNRSGDNLGKGRRDWRRCCDDTSRSSSSRLLSPPPRFPKQKHIAPVSIAKTQWFTSSLRAGS
ncbi:hypothetical protein B0H14DRAFT_2588066 [Mycena olivaceomarginata]|nr:hypothetical protein B0H14DRAFT_2588066 [Mycena olivaceomarginata]